MKRILGILTLALLAFALVAVPALAKKKTFKTGTYTATGDVSFKFKIYKGTCYDAKFKKKSGYCFKGFQGPPTIAMKCDVVPDGVNDHEETAFIPDQKLLSSSGKISVSFKNPIRTDEWDQHTFKITIGSKGKASGSVELVQQVKSLKVISMCRSGKLKFTAKKK